MKIGFDGKRAYQNHTGLGNYSRTLVTVLSQHYPEHDYTLFAPKQTTLFDTGRLNNVSAIFPQTLLYRNLPGLWRRTGIVKDIASAGMDVFHGVSNELPAFVEKIAAKSVVTVHDLIFERYPKTYHRDERYVYRWKIKKACKLADAVIAISEQTKNDLVDLYNVPPAKIFICYQSCNPIFEQPVSERDKILAKKRYNLPDVFFLFVSSVAPRKNLVVICKAMILQKDKMNIPLVVIGQGNKEKESVRQLMKNSGMADRLIFLNELPVAREDPFTTGADFPAIYQQAKALIYPSLYEGFGLPVLEALWSRVPVICSNTSSMPEIAGEAALYFEPFNHELLAQHMFEILTDKTLAGILIAKGIERAHNFTTKKYAESIMQVYNDII